MQICAGLLLVFLFAVPPQKHAPSSRGLAFSAEDDHVSAPAALPPPVFDLLVQVESRHWNGDTIRPEWFSAEKVSVSGRSAELLLVQAEGPLRGANVSEFWLVQQDTQHHTASLLWTSPEHDVTLKLTPASPYPSIQTERLSAGRLWTARYAYEHGTYVLVRKSVKKR